MPADTDAEVAIVMMDDREPDLAKWLERHERNVFSLEEQAQLVTILTWYLNLRYARRHGYSLVFYRLGNPGCTHPVWGARHPSYCKLTAIGEALAAGYSWVVYLDSDAFIRSHEPLPTLLRKYGGALEGADAAQAFFGWDHPFTLGPNMGFIALRNTATVVRMVQSWWNLNAGPFSELHPFEQRTLQWQIMHLDQYSRIITTLSLRTMDDAYPDGVVHLDHNAGTKTRIWVMAGAAAAMLAEGEGAQALLLRRHLHVLQRQREGIHKALRRPAIEAVVKAARLDLGDRASHSLGQLIVPFNASESALERLWRPAEDALLRDEAIAGMPLQLANCSAVVGHPYAPWQTWTLTTERLTPKLGSNGAKHDKCTGLCLAHRLSLRAMSTLCLSLGKMRTPRNPFQVQAQLAPCTASVETPEAVRARLHFSLKTGTIKSTHR